LQPDFISLLFDEAGKIKVLDSRFEIFYKGDEEATYHPQISRPDYGRGSISAPHAGQATTMRINAPSAGQTRKEGKKRGNGEDKPRVNIEGG